MRCKYARLKALCSEVPNKHKMSLPPGSDLAAYLKNAVPNRTRQVKSRTLTRAHTKTKSVCTRAYKLRLRAYITARRWRDGSIEIYNILYCTSHNSPFHKDVCPWCNVLNKHTVQVTHHAFAIIIDGSFSAAKAIPKPIQLVQPH